MGRMIKDLWNNEKLKLYMDPGHQDTISEEVLEWCQGKKAFDQGKVMPVPL